MAQARRRVASRLPKRGELLGQGHLQDLGPGEWWLEGFRVRPEAQGQGVGSHIRDHFINQWLETGGRVVRLAINVERAPVHRMCERTGFVRIATFARLEGQCATADAEGDLRPVDRVHLDRWAARLGELAGVQWLPWRGDSGGLLLLMNRDEKKAQRVGIDLPGGAFVPALRELLRWCRQSGLQFVTWLGPTRDGYTQAAEEAGFATEPSRFHIYRRVR